MSNCQLHVPAAVDLLTKSVPNAQADNFKAA